MNRTRLPKNKLLTTRKILKNRPKFIKNKLLKNNLHIKGKKKANLINFNLKQLVKNWKNSRSKPATIKNKVLIFSEDG